MVGIHHGEWVVVCDGAKALILENIGDPDLPNLKTREVHQQPDLPTRELGADAPGRAFGSVGAVRSAVGQTDWHAQTEHDFLVSLVKRLEAGVGAGQVKSLVVVAPPRALGVLRQAYSPALKRAIRLEIDKDLVKTPVHEIEKHLST